MGNCWILEGYGVFFEVLLVVFLELVFFGIGRSGDFYSRVSFFDVYRGFLFFFGNFELSFLYGLE